MLLMHSLYKQNYKIKIFNFKVMSIPNFMLPIKNVNIKCNKYISTYITAKFNI